MILCAINTETCPLLALGTLLLSGMNTF